MISCNELSITLSALWLDQSSTAHKLIENPDTSVRNHQVLVMLSSATTARATIDSHVQS